MNNALLAAAKSLDARAEACKDKAVSEAKAAVAANNTEALRLSTIEGIRSTIYKEVAASLREAAQQSA